MLSLIVFTAIIPACSASNELGGSSSSDGATSGGDTNSPSSTGAGIGSNLLWAAAYGNGVFVAVTDQGAITTSTDGSRDVSL